jgi:hypothetical protein
MYSCSRFFKVCSCNLFLGIFNPHQTAIEPAIVAPYPPFSATRTAIADLRVVFGQATKEIEWSSGFTRTPPILA